MNKDCPNCFNSRKKEELRICNTNCDMIVCDDCKIEHLVSDHADFREIDDEEWDDIE